MPWEEPAPRATCGAGDMPEGELQGEGIENVRCNLTVHGQVQVPHFLSLAWHENCAYVNSTDATSVVDVSDSSAPTVVTKLTTTGMQNNWESMKVHEGRGLLAGYQADGTVVDLYDVSADCKAPVFQSSLNVGGIGHSGNFSEDGSVYYASSLYSGEVFAIDVMDPAQPRLITSKFFDTAGNSIGSHDLSIGKNGTRGYFTFPSLINAFNGTLAIVDLTSVKERADAAEGRSVKDFEWQDGAASQYPIPITYRGADHLVVTDELGSGACGNPAKPHFGYAHIFDLRDEQMPRLVSQVKTAAQDAANCEAATRSAGTFFGVGTHYCNVDRRDDPRLLSCGLWSGGVRVFDIRNPWRPREIAYFDTAGTDDMVPGLQRILVDKRELWVASTAGTFYVLKFADGVIDEMIPQ